MIGPAASIIVSAAIVDARWRGDMPVARGVVELAVLALLIGMEKPCEVDPAGNPTTRAIWVLAQKIEGRLARAEGRLS